MSATRTRYSSSKTSTNSTFEIDGFESHELFPRKVNVEFVEVKSPTELRMRVWNVIPATHACGSGACATLVAAVRRGLAERKADIVLDGGTLSIYWRDDNHSMMTGAAAHVFDGIYKDVLKTTA